jgi:hypothetical protein
MAILGLEAKICDLIYRDEDSGAWLKATEFRGEY